MDGGPDGPQRPPQFMDDIGEGAAAHVFQRPQARGEEVNGRCQLAHFARAGNGYRLGPSAGRDAVHSGGGGDDGPL